MCRLSSELGASHDKICRNPKEGKKEKGSLILLLRVSIYCLNSWLSRSGCWELNWLLRCPSIFSKSHFWYFYFFFGVNPKICDVRLNTTYNVLYTSHAYVDTWTYLRTIITSVHIVTIDYSSADRRKYNIICWERKGVLVIFRIRKMTAITFLNAAPATWICFQQFLSQNKNSGSINLVTKFWIWNQGKSTQLLLAVQLWCGQVETKIDNQPRGSA